MGRALQSNISHVRLGFTKDFYGGTSNFRYFGNEPASMAVYGLWGCYSIVAISRMGVWASHFWEDHVDSTEAIFEEHVLKHIRNGDAKSNVTVKSLLEIDLAQLRSPRRIFPFNPMSDSHEPRIFLIAPQADRFPNSQNGTEAGSLPPLHPDKHKRIRDELEKLFNSRNATIWDLWYQPLAYKAGVDMDDTRMESGLGKLIVQYQPAWEGCGQKDTQAQWRMYFEGRGTWLYDA